MIAYLRGRVIDIGAETPAEIAISIAAELIAHRAQSLKEAL